MSTANQNTNGDGEYSPVEEARDELQDAVPEAAATLRELLDAEDERIQIRAAEAILSRAGLSKASKPSDTKLKQEVGGATRDGPIDDLM